MHQPTRALSAKDRLDWLRLIRTENVGPVTFRHLVARFGTAGAALEALPELSRRGGRARPLKPASKAEAERELAALERLGTRLVAVGEADYPPALAPVDDAPPLLAVRGYAHLLQRPMVGMVGARNASINGRRLAQRLAGEVAAAGFLVVSGLARGIDSAAHEGALAGGTAAVMAGGIDVVYPPENTDLYARIIEAGVAVSETPPGTQPQARHFPRRNRLISGLALGVVVVEAAPRSGSLITARLAGEQGREVFAVPGSPLDPRAQGCNQLIRGGATLVQSADDILEGLRAMTTKPLADRQGTLFATLPAEPVSVPTPVDVPEEVRAAILEWLSPTPTPVDELLRECQFSAAVIWTVLLELELAGRVERQPGNRVSLI